MGEQEVAKNMNEFNGLNGNKNDFWLVSGLKNCQRGRRG
jgi:hypothetical protein